MRRGLAARQERILSLGVLRDAARTPRERDVLTARINHEFARYVRAARKEAK